MKIKLLNNQPWLYGSFVDSIFILFPPFICLALIFIFPTFFIQNNLSNLSWLLLVVFIDVAHVYSTLFRTYFHKPTFNKNKILFTFAPLVALVVSILVYSIKPILFWRILAYLAVFHFIRQQYGFVKLYSRNEFQTKIQMKVDSIMIYASTIYPIIYWHFSADRKFTWFVQDDFITYKSNFILNASLIAYSIVILTYLTKEFQSIVKTKKINLPKNAIIFGSSLSWYFGIVYFNSDITFSLLNIICHGIPYMSLIWIFSIKQKSIDYLLIGKSIFSKFGILFFLLLILLLAYSEEGLWDYLVWKEHSSLFKIFPKSYFILDKSLIAIIVPLLSVPQITHYIIDGFIWKVSKEKIV
jgi:hypothetical protein